MLAYREDLRARRNCFITESPVEYDADSDDVADLLEEARRQRCSDVVSRTSDKLVDVYLAVLVLARLDARRGREASQLHRRRLFEQMQRAFPGGEILAPKDQPYEYGLSDPDDGHVAHAAVLGRADAIVTDDTRAGFQTASTLIEAGIEVLHSHQFAASTVAAHPHTAVRALIAMSQRLRHPPRSPSEIVHELHERYGMTEVAEILEPELARL